MGQQVQRGSCLVQRSFHPAHEKMGLRIAPEMLLIGQRMSVRDTVKSTLLYEHTPWMTCRSDSGSKEGVMEFGNRLVDLSTAHQARQQNAAAIWVGSLSVRTLQIHPPAAGCVVFCFGAGNGP